MKDNLQAKTKDTGFGAFYPRQTRFTHEQKDWLLLGDTLRYYDLSLRSLLCGGHPIVVPLCQTPVKKSIRDIRVICGFPTFRVTPSQILRSTSVNGQK